jgi:hypothetical protein
MLISHYYNHLISKESTMHKKSLVTLLMLICALTMAVYSAGAQMKGKTKYLVIGDYIDPGPLAPPQQTVQMLENAVLPSFDILSKLEAEKKLSGGIYVGERKGVFIIEAESNDEVDKFLHTLPFWGLLKWTVSPLQTFSARGAEDKAGIEMMKSMK